MLVTGFSLRVPGRSRKSRSDAVLLAHHRVDQRQDFAAGRLGRAQRRHQPLAHCIRVCLALIDDVQRLSDRVMNPLMRPLQCDIGTRRAKLGFARAAVIPVPETGVTMLDRNQSRLCALALALDRNVGILHVQDVIHLHQRGKRQILRPVQLPDGLFG